MANKKPAVVPQVKLEKTAPVVTSGETATTSVDSVTTPPSAAADKNMLYLQSKEKVRTV